MQKVQETGQQEVIRVIQNTRIGRRWEKFVSEGHDVRREEEYDKYLKLTNNNAPGTS